MLKKLMPVVLALSGLGAGVAAGLALRPTEEAGAQGAEAEGSTDEITVEAGEENGEAKDDAPVLEYVKMSNQFVIPLLEDGRVVSMVVLSLSLEAKTGSTEAVYAREPKLRDSFLQILFDHANSGGFRGSYTDGANLLVLRRTLLETAKKVMPDQITDVLIADIIRQDV